MGAEALDLSQSRFWPGLVRSGTRYNRAIRAGTLQWLLEPIRFDGGTSSLRKAITRPQTGFFITSLFECFRGLHAARDS